MKSLRRLTFGLDKADNAKLGATGRDLDVRFDAALSHIPALSPGDDGYSEEVALRKHIENMRQEFKKQALKNLSLSDLKAGGEDAKKCKRKLHKQPWLLPQQLLRI